MAEPQERLFIEIASDFIGKGFDAAAGAISSISGMVTNVLNKAFDGAITITNAYISVLQNLGTFIFDNVIVATLELEKAMVGVKKTANLTSDEVAILTQELKGISNATGTAIVDLAKMAEVAGSLGVKKADISGFVEVVNQMAVALGFSAEKAAEAGAMIANSFRLSIDAESVRRIGDILNSIENATVVTGQKLADFLMQFGTTASMMKISLEDAAALGTVLIGVGMDASDAGTRLGAAIRQMLNAQVGATQELENWAKSTKTSVEDWIDFIQRGGPELDKFAESWGKSADEITKWGLQAGGKIGELGKLLGMNEEAIRKLANTDMIELLRRTAIEMEKISDVTLRNQKLTELFGIVGAKAFGGLIGNVDKLNEALELAHKKTSPIQQEFETLLNSSYIQWQKITESIKNFFMVDLGSKFMPLINLFLKTVGGDVLKFITLITNYVNKAPWFSVLMQQAGFFIVSLQGLARSLMDAIMANMDGFSAVGSSVLADLSRMTSSVMGVIQENGRAWVAYFLQIFNQVSVVIRNFVTYALAEFPRLFNILLAYADNVVQTYNQIVEALPKIFAAVSGFFQKLEDAYWKMRIQFANWKQTLSPESLKSVNDALGSIGGAFNALTAIINGTFDPKQMAEISNRLKAFFQQITGYNFDAVIAGIADLGNSIKNFAMVIAGVLVVSSFTTMIGSILGGLVAGVGAAAVTAAMTALAAKLGLALLAVIGIGLTGGISLLVLGIIGKITTSLSGEGFLGAIKSAGSSIFFALKSGFGSAWDYFFGGKDIQIKAPQIPEIPQEPTGGGGIDTGKALQVELSFKHTGDDFIDYVLDNLVARAQSRSTCACSTCG